MYVIVCDRIPKESLFELFIPLVSFKKPTQFLWDLYVQQIAKKCDLYKQRDEGYGVILLPLYNLGRKYKEQYDDSRPNHILKLNTNYK